MRRLFFAAFLLFLTTVEAVAGIKDTQLTIYSQNLAPGQTDQRVCAEKGRKQTHFHRYLPQV